MIVAAARDMEIRFISSLTGDDENAFAPAVLKAVTAVLDQFPIAYTLRIETTGAHVFQHTHPPVDVVLPRRLAKADSRGFAARRAPSHG